MRLLLSSDWHLDWYTGGFPRFFDVTQSAHAVVRLAIRERCDGFVFLGDLANPGARAHRCSAFAIEVASDLAHAGIWSRWLVGNHDTVEDGTGASTLTPLASHAFTLSKQSVRFPKPVDVWSDPRVEALGEGVVAVALPHPSQGKLYTPDDFIRNVSYSELPGERRRVLVFGHLTVPGIDPGSETKDMPRGRAVRYPIEAIRERWGDAAILFNGHYHRLQKRAQGPVIVPGTLERLTKGEASNAPHCLIVEI